jgi:hypothetical protein
LDIQAYQPLSAILKLIKIDYWKFIKMRIRGIKIPLRYAEGVAAEG